NREVVVGGNLIFTQTIEGAAALVESGRCTNRTIRRRRRADPELNISVGRLVDRAAIHDPSPLATEAAKNKPVVHINDAAVHNKMPGADAAAVGLAEPHFMGR